MSLLYFFNSFLIPFIVNKLDLKNIMIRISQRDVWSCRPCSRGVVFKRKFLRTFNHFCFRMAGFWNLKKKERYDLIYRGAGKNHIFQKYPVQAKSIPYKIIVPDNGGIKKSYFCVRDLWILSYDQRRYPFQFWSQSNVSSPIKL